ncbi:NAD(P)-dependent oxidoreductase [Microbacterium sp.]|uniref:NAD-dependent epimerase/dehydratase family protein n=1 Tax=Microbacterium sp. TaxID=51671 RepID=UPI00273685C7|nr:NAD(P)-dependent oxidoreductase [Microbacterium sp.]MDP3951401.1 NAD(P)-dependent oxidoreductase [Microbacterium sp.]
MQLLIIGGGGVVGRAIVRHLPAHRLTILDRVPTRSEPAASIVGDATDLETLREAMRDVDAVVHLAAVVPRAHEVHNGSRVHEAFRVNVTGVYLALRAAREHGIRRFVHASTMSVFEDYGRVRIDTRSEPDSTQPYGQSKRLAENLCASAAQSGQMTVTSLRLAFPTTEELWPTWRSPGSPNAEPRRPSLADGTGFDALAPSDLARAVEAALTRTGSYAAVSITGDAEGVSLTDDSASLIGWRPERR